MSDSDERLSEMRRRLQIKLKQERKAEDIGRKILIVGAVIVVGIFKLAFFIGTIYIVVEVLRYLNVL